MMNFKRMASRVELSSRNSVFNKTGDRRGSRSRLRSNWMLGVNSKSPSPMTSRSTTACPSGSQTPRLSRPPSFSDLPDLPMVSAILVMPDDDSDTDLPIQTCSVVEHPVTAPEQRRNSEIERDKLLGSLGINEKALIESLVDLPFLADGVDGSHLKSLFRSLLETLSVQQWHEVIVSYTKTGVIPKSVNELKAVFDRANKNELNQGGANYKRLCEQSGLKTEDMAVSWKRVQPYLAAKPVKPKAFKAAFNKVVYAYFGTLFNAILDKVDSGRSYLCGGAALSLSVDPSRDIHDLDFCIHEPLVEVEEESSRIRFVRGLCDETGPVFEKINPTRAYTEIISMVDSMFKGLSLEVESGVKTILGVPQFLDPYAKKTLEFVVKYPTKKRQQGKNFQLSASVHCEAPPESYTKIGRLRLLQPRDIAIQKLSALINRTKRSQAFFKKFIRDYVDFVLSLLQMEKKSGSDHDIQFYLDDVVHALIQKAHEPLWQHRRSVALITVGESEKIRRLIKQNIAVFSYLINAGYDKETRTNWSDMLAIQSLEEALPDKAPIGDVENERHGYDSEDEDNIGGLLKAVKTYAYAPKDTRSPDLPSSLSQSEETICEAFKLAVEYGLLNSRRDACKEAIQGRFPFTDRTPTVRQDEEDPSRYNVSFGEQSKKNKLTKQERKKLKKRVKPLTKETQSPLNILLDMLFVPKRSQSLDKQVQQLLQGFKTQHVFRRLSMLMPSESEALVPYNPDSCDLLPFVRQYFWAQLLVGPGQQMLENEQTLSAERGIGSDR